jgi:hypothetical protein
VAINRPLFAGVNALKPVRARYQDIQQEYEVVLVLLFGCWRYGLPCFGCRNNYSETRKRHLPGWILECRSFVEDHGCMGPLSVVCVSERLKQFKKTGNRPVNIRQPSKVSFYGPVLPVMTAPGRELERHHWREF